MRRAIPSTVYQISNSKRRFLWGSMILYKRFITLRYSPGSRPGSTYKYGS